jgi:hypothetical protein
VRALLGQRALAVLGERDAVPVEAKPAPERAQDRGVVVDDEDAAGGGDEVFIRWRSAARAVGVVVRMRCGSSLSRRWTAAGEAAISTQLPSSVAVENEDFCQLVGADTRFPFTSPA